MRALLLSIVIPMVISFPQDKLKGKVLDGLNGEALAGVNIYIAGTRYGTSSDEYGNFLLEKPKDSAFNISASIIGYSTTSLSIDSLYASEIIIRMHRKIISLPDIMVSVSRPALFKYNLIHMPVLKAKNMAGNLNDISRSIYSLPGFAKPNDYRNDLMVRGGSSSENLFLIDGIIVPSISHFGNQGYTGGAVSYIDPALMSNISVSSGGFTSVYGDRLSAVIDLELRESMEHEFTNTLSLSGTQFSFSSEYAFPSNLNYLLSVRRSFLDPVFRLYGFFYYPEYYDLLGKISWKIDSFNSLSFIFIGTLDQIKFFDVPDDIRNDNPRAVGSNQSRFITGVTFKSISDHGSLNLSLSRNDFKYNTVPNFFFSNDSYEAENTLKGDLIYNFTENIALNAGSVLSIIQFNINAEFYNYRSSYNEMYNTLVKGSRTFIKSGSYINYSQKFNSLHFNAGVRLDYFSPLKSERTISPRFSINYKANDFINLILKTGIYNQTPSYVWLIGHPGNTRLTSLRSDHLIIGADVKVSDETKLKAETYIKEYRKYPVSAKRPYLVMANTGSEFSGTDNNFASYGIEPLLSRGKGTSQGVEFSIHHSSQSIPLTVESNVSISKTLFYGIDNIKHYSSYDQTWIINFSAAYNFNEIWSANLKFFYASGVPYTPFEENGVQKPERFNQLRMPPVHSMDLRLEMKFYSNSSSLVYLDIKNIYNRENLYYYYFDSIRKEVAHDPAIRILPSIGITLAL